VELRGDIFPLSIWSINGLRGRTSSFNPEELGNFHEMVEKMLILLTLSMRSSSLRSGVFRRST
jgi:hypothetical protein